MPKINLPPLNLDSTKTVEVGLKTQRQLQNYDSQVKLELEEEIQQLLEHKSQLNALPVFSINEYNINSYTQQYSTMSCNIEQQIKYVETQMTEFQQRMKTFKLFSHDTQKDLELLLQCAIDIINKANNICSIVESEPDNKKLQLIIAKKRFQLILKELARIKLQQLHESNEYNFTYLQI